MVPTADGTPIGDASVRPEPQLSGPMLGEVEHLRELLPGLPEEDLRFLAFRLWPSIRDELMPGLLERAQADAAPRVLHDGVDVYQNSAGAAIWYKGGAGRFPILNFLGGTVYIDSASNRNQVDITLGGGGIFCYDALVSNEWTGAQGALVSSFEGNTFRIYSTIQGCINAMVAGEVTHTFGDVLTVAVCHGIYTETLSFPSINLPSLSKMRFEALGGDVVLQSDGTIAPVTIASSQVSTLTFVNFSLGIRSADNVTFDYDGKFAVGVTLVLEDCFASGDVKLTNGGVVTLRNTRIRGFVDNEALNQAGPVLLSVLDGSTISGGISLRGNVQFAQTHTNSINIESSHVLTGLLQLARAVGNNDWRLRVDDSKFGTVGIGYADILVKRDAADPAYDDSLVAFRACTFYGHNVGSHVDIIKLVVAAGNVMRGVLIEDNQWKGFNNSDPGPPILHPVSIQGLGTVEAALIHGNDWGENPGIAVTGVVVESGGTLNNSIVTDNVPGTVINSLSGTGNVDGAGATAPQGIPGEQGEQGEQGDPGPPGISGLDPSDISAVATVSTTNATVTTLQTLTIPASTTVHIETRVSARRTGGAAGVAEDEIGRAHV